MKLVSLNIYGGRVYEPLIKFLEDNKDVDIFCFQEVYGKAHGKEIIYTDAKLDIYEDVKNTLNNYTGYWRPHLGDYYGLAIFLKNNLKVVDEGEFYVHREKGYIPNDHVGFHAKNIQYVKIFLNNKLVNIINFHGLWNGNGKTDTEERIKQSTRIKQFVDLMGGDKIVCGDFNLRPDTESIKIVESAGLKNLIKDFDIKSTRTSLYAKPEKFADYVFVSPGIETKDFKVLPDEVSDHAALYLEF